VGGDGSVNEIGQGLINTNTSLAILPAGSGNGLARHLKIPMSIKKAIELINNSKTLLIDTVKINDNYFIGTAGVGFDAYIAAGFEEAPTRGLWTYIKVALKGFLKYKAKDYTIEYDGIAKTINKGLLVTLSNSSQYGNNIIISPNSKVDDGKLRLIVVKKFPLIYLPIFGYYLLSKQINKSKFTEEIVFKKMVLINQSEIIHLDGESLKMEKRLQIEVIPRSLKIIVP
jgi:diacylglycerol kinase (ATP)